MKKNTQLNSRSIHAAEKRSMQHGVIAFSESMGHGKGSLRVVIRNATTRFYYRYQNAEGRQDDLPLGIYESDSRNVDKALGKLSITLARECARDAVRDNDRAKAKGFTGVREFREQTAAALAKERAELAAYEEAEAKARELEGKYTLEALLHLYVSIKEDQGVASYKDAHRLFNKYIYSEAVAQKAANQVERKELAAIIREVKASTKREWQKLRSYLLAAYNAALDAEDDESADPRYVPFEIAQVPISKPKQSGILATATRERVLSEDELRGLLLKLRADDSYKSDLLKFVLLTGQRMEQFLRARLADLDLSAKILTLYDLKGRRNEPKRHYVYLQGESLDIAVKYFDQAERVGAKYLFSLDPHNHISQDTLSRYGTAVARDLVAEGICHEPFQSRDLRRTVATEMSRLAIADDTKKRLLSHGVSGVHDKHYNKYSYENELRNAAASWEAELERIESKSDSMRKVINIR